MNNPFFEITLALAVLAVLLNIGQAEDTQRPNIVVIMVDDLGYADVGFNESTDIPTPSLDQLAKAGTVFTSAYVVHPFCGPSRVGLLSGRYPHVMGAQYNLPESGAGEEGIPVGETLISKVLQDSGYFTGLIGKWHLGESSPFHPNNRGFNDFYGFLGGGHSYFPSKFGPKYEQNVRAGNKNIWNYIKPLEHNGTEVKETEYVTDGLSREGVRFINEAAKKDQPFFLFLSYNAPHTPLEAKEDDLKQVAGIADKDRRTFAAMVYAVDRGVSKIVEALKATDKFDNTLIVFLSDNGGRTDSGANNAPLRGSKGDTLEGGFRVPMFFHWPNVVAAGKKFEHPVSALDFYPTFAGLAESKIPADKQLDGKNIWDDFLAGRNPRKGETIYALRHRTPNNDVGARRDQWKLHRSGRKPWQLFNVENDIGEQQDLSARYPEQVQSMVAEVKKWSESHIEPHWQDTEASGKKWKETGMPNYEATFQLNGFTETSTTGKTSSTGKSRARGEKKEEYVTRMKRVWKKNGWKWSQSKVEANFVDIDTNQDGIVSHPEEQAWFANRKRAKR